MNNKEINKNQEIIEDHNKIIKNHLRKIEGHEELIDDLNNTIDQHSEKIEEHYKWQTKSLYVLGVYTVILVASMFV